MSSSSWADRYELTQSYRITAILISRFLIDLQEANIKSMHQNSLGSVGTLDFNGFVGSVTFRLSAPEEVSDFTDAHETSGASLHSELDVGISARCSHEDTASSTV